MVRNVSYRDILRHASNHMSQTQIALACGCARSTVQDVLRLAKEKNITWSDVASLSDVAAYELIRGRPKELASEYVPLDFEHIHREMERDRTMTLSLLWEEYATRATYMSKKAYGYSRFCELYGAWCDKQDVAITRKYIPGDLGEFDWAGQTMSVQDALTGDSSVAWLFVATLPYSQKTYVGAFPSMDIEMWCLASRCAFEYFGGVPRLLTIDNLKTGVTKHTKDEIVLNRTFKEFAEYYNVAVIPHAPRAPRGKSAVESNVGKIANKIRNMLRNQVFFSFDELNLAIGERLQDLNARPFQKRAGSRDEVFEGVERQALQTLPDHPFEIAHWGSSHKVSKSYHVLLPQDGVYYSVPWRYVGQHVEMRWTATKVEIFCEGERIATHVRNRSLERGQSVTDPTHRPKAHADFLDHDSSWYRAQASEVGPATASVVESFLGEGLAEEQGWRWCEKLLLKRGTVGDTVLEEVCTSALHVSAHPSFKVLSTLLRNRQRTRTTTSNPTSSQDYALHRY